MPQMLREEAFHLAAGVVPMRRWVTAAAKGGIFVTMLDLQKALNKWVPRALEMFGDERGGGTNVRFGLKPMKNSEAQAQYVDEIGKLVRDLNVRYIRAIDETLSPTEADALLDRLLAEGGTQGGIDAADLLRLPHNDYFRRRGVPAFKMVGVDGETFTDLRAYLQHLVRTLPDSYRASRDFKDYVELMTQVQAGTVKSEEAAGRMPSLRRVGGACTCSKAVRWVVDEPLVQPAA
jgi:hypothetical protein